MKFIYFFFIFILAGFQSRAVPDTVRVPLQRRYFHDKIDYQQKLLDKGDGKLDNSFHISGNEEINLRITDVLFRKIDEFQDWVESNEQLANNNEKIRFLSYIENVLKEFRLSWKKKNLSPVEFPLFIENCEAILKKQAEGASMAALIERVPYEIARINTEIFFDNPGFNEAQGILYLKYCSVYPDKILQTIRPYADAPFADSLIVVACARNPVQLYSYAQSASSPEGRLIHRNTDGTVMAVAKQPPLSAPHRHRS